MNYPEFNRIFASLLIAGIIAMLCGFIAKQIVHPEELSKNAVLINVAVAAEAAPAAPAPETASTEAPTAEAGTMVVAAADTAAAPAADAAAVSALSLVASADVAKGKTAAKACAACHNFDKGGKNGVGPNLWGVVNRKKDSVEGFKYSGAYGKAGNPTWTYGDLSKMLAGPKAYAPGTKMAFPGLKKPEDRAAVIAYLRTLADAPAALPSAADIAADK